MRSCRLPFTSRVTLDDYWLVNAAASYKLQPGVEMFGRVEMPWTTTIKRCSALTRRGIAAFAGLKLTFGGPEGFGGSRK